MDIFKLYESTMANIQPGHSIKHLRRDQLLDNYEAAAKTLQTLIRAKEGEISHKKDLIKMLEESKVYHDTRLQQAKHEYHTAKSHIPEGVDLKSISVKNQTIERSTTPPFPPPPSASTITMTPMPVPTSAPPPVPLPVQVPAPAPTMIPSLSTPANSGQNASASQSSMRSSDFDIPLPSDNYDNRSSLDRRLSEFLKTFPNLTQAGLAPTNNTDATKPSPGYYTHQAQIPTAPPSMELLRFPPPNMMLPTQPNKYSSPSSSQSSHSSSRGKTRR